MLQQCWPWRDSFHFESFSKRYDAQVTLSPDRTAALGIQS